MPLGMPGHDEGTDALDDLLTEFVSAAGFESSVTTEEPYGKYSQYQIDNFVEICDGGSLPALAVEFETGTKTHPRIRREIRQRFERYRSMGFQPIVAAVGFVLDAGDDETLRDVAKEFDAGVLELDASGSEFRFRPGEGMESGTLARLAKFLR